MTEEQIKHMVQRFLGWRLPENFSPDAGISFKPTYNENSSWGPQKHEPIGTNLFDASQAEAMVRYIIAGIPDGAESVTQTWTWSLTYMQQSVLLAAIRGPDGIDKNHVSKRLVRWLRRCVLLGAFERAVLARPYDEGGGSFTGQSIERVGERHFRLHWSAEVRDTWQAAMHDVLDDYMRATDAIPHHFQLHFLHAAEILGYKHPEAEVRDWWLSAYRRLVNDMHLLPESEKTMDRRLGDREADWRAAEEVTADR